MAGQNEDLGDGSPLRGVPGQSPGIKGLGMKRSETEKQHVKEVLIIIFVQTFLFYA